MRRHWHLIQVSSPSPTKGCRKTRTNLGVIKTNFSDRYIFASMCYARQNWIASETRRRPRLRHVLQGRRVAARQIQFYNLFVQERKTLVFPIPSRSDYRKTYWSRGILFTVLAHVVIYLNPRRYRCTHFPFTDVVYLHAYTTESRGHRVILLI